MHFAKAKQKPNENRIDKNFHNEILSFYSFDNVSNLASKHINWCIIEYVCFVFEQPSRSQIKYLDWEIKIWIFVE